MSALATRTATARPQRGGTEPTKGRGGLRVASLLVADWRSRLGLIVVLSTVVFAIVGPWLFPGDPAVADYTIPPSQPPGAGHPLGTDQGGRDVFLQFVHGAAPTLAVGFSVGAIATALAALVGIVSGSAGKVVDGLLTLLTNTFLLIPGLPLVIVIASYVQSRSNAPIVMILAITGWAYGARVLRSQAMSLANRDFVLAAKVRGERPWRIVVFEILPNMLSLIATIFISATAGAIAAMAGLQFLGLGDISQVNWFTSLYWAQNYGAVMTGAWWTFVPNGLAIATFVTGLSLVGYGLDAIGNPRLRVPRRTRRARVSPARQESAAAEATDALLAVRDLVVDYDTAEGPSRAVDGVSFDLTAGKVLGIAGESGCGKSTIVHAILRLGPTTMATSGLARFDGQNLLTLPEERLRALRWERVSIVSQSSMNALSPVRTVGNHFVDTIAAHRGLDRSRCRERAAELLALVGIHRDRLDSYPHELSGGMRQRVMIALALALEPELIVMDEPTTALDVIVQREILQQIADLQSRLGFAMIFITHDLSLLLEISDEIAVMRRGRFVEVGAAKSFAETAADPYSRELLAAFPSLADGLVGGGKAAGRD